MNDVKKIAIDYLFHKATADKKKAELSLELLMNNPAGIGDHSTGDFHKNLEEAWSTLVDAQDSLDRLKEKYDIGD